MINEQSTECVKLASTSQDMTFSIGIALSASLYKKNTSLWLSGELGAGKTTLVRGLGIGLGLVEIVTSPTYALENRYGQTLLHIDLYRLNTADARRIIAESEEFPGIRAMEWADRVMGGTGDPSSAKLRTDTPAPPSSITVHFKEASKTTRTLRITFADLRVPEREQIKTWRREMELPDHIGKHCDAVGAFSKKCAEELLTRGTVCRPEAVRIAGELHDIMRFVDFKPEVHKKIPHAKEPDPETQKHWDALREKYGDGHEDACSAFLEEHGYPELSTIIRPHGLRSADHPEHFTTIEQKILYYADKRIKYNQVVSLDERFDDFTRRYSDGVESSWGKMTREKTKEMERDLFGNESP
jgi:tRNA threonylcarbamoyladenosine biosynthesis protein TsaE